MQFSFTLNLSTDLSSPGNKNITYTHTYSRTSSMTIIFASSTKTGKFKEVFSHNDLLAFLKEKETSGIKSRVHS